jgi:hypothetical protein
MVLLVLEVTALENLIGDYGSLLALGGDLVSIESLVESGSSLCRIGTFIREIRTGAGLGGGCDGDQVGCGQLCCICLWDVVGAVRNRCRKGAECKGTCKEDVLLKTHVVYRLVDCDALV